MLHDFIDTNVYLTFDSVLGELLTAAKTIKVDDATVAAAQRRTAIEQAKKLLEAAVVHSQIASIARDPDVHEFFTELDERYGHLLDATMQARFAGRFGPDDEEARSDV